MGCGTGHIYRSSGATKVQEPDARDLEDMELHLFDKSEVLSAIKDGRVLNMSHMAAILLALNEID